MSSPITQDDKSLQVLEKNDKIMMKVLQKCTVFNDKEVEEDGRAKILYSVAVCDVGGDDRLIVRMSCHLSDIPDELEKSDELNGVIVREEDICPKLNQGDFSLASPDVISDCFIKRYSLLEYEPGKETPSTLLLQEAGVAEALKKFPHPNLAIYLGCLNRGDALVGLCFEKYSETLEHRIRQQLEIGNIDDCVDGIRQGIEHLHSIGYCHNDISPVNIMFRHGETTPIIIDFDSCLPVGQKMEIKVGTPGFYDEDATHSEPHNDFFSLELLEKYMRSCAAESRDKL